MKGHSKTVAELLQAIDEYDWRVEEAEKLKAERDQLKAELAKLQEERDNLKDQLDRLRKAFNSALDIVDEVFYSQGGGEAILPGFLLPGECKFESVKTLAIAYRNAKAELAKLQAEREPIDNGDGTVTELTFHAFRAANVTRCAKWHPQGIDSWSPSDWLTAVAGELGELASLLKMRNRERDGLPGNKFSPSQKQIADELADVVTYLDLLAHVLGVDLGSAVVEKFNEVSERVGFSDRIELVAAPKPTEPVTWEAPALTDGLWKTDIYEVENEEFGFPWGSICGLTKPPILGKYRFKDGVGTLIQESK